MYRKNQPRLAVFKFTSCDGCQLSLLDCEDELLEIAEAVNIAYFVEARRQMLEGPYDVALIEGSITTDEEIQRIKEVRRKSQMLVAIGACATAGGIQALRNWADVETFTNLVYAHPEYVETLETSRPISDFVTVDFELRGCPISKRQLLELVTSLLIGRKPRTPAHSVCLDCKRTGSTCVMVARGLPCLGPVTQAGCGALCPAYHRGCYGCFGPAASSNPFALGNRLIALEQSPRQVAHAFRSFNGYAPAFREVGDHYEQESER